MAAAYTVVIYEQATNEFLMEKGLVNARGLQLLLKYLTDLNRDGRNAFMYELQRLGTATHIPNRTDARQYSVSAIENRT